MNDITLTPEEIEAAKIAKIKQPIVEGGITRYDARTKPHYWIYVMGVDVWNRWGKNETFDDDIQKAQIIFKEITANIKKYCGQDKTLPSPNEVVDFKYTIWHEEINFNYFIFNSECYFDNSIFRHNCYFGGAKYEDQPYAGVIFNKKVNFIEVKFDCFAYFLKVSFNIVSFRRSIFNENVYFYKTIFNCSSENENSVDFRSANFIKNADFNEVIFKANLPDFRGVTFQKYVVFSIGAKYFSFDIAKSATISKNKCINHAEITATRYSILKKAMREMQFADKELFFHGKELEAKSYDENEPLKWLYKKYGQFSDYGQSISRPLKWLGLTIMIATLCYYFHGIYFNARFIYVDILDNISYAAYSALYYTFPFMQSDTVLHEIAFDLKDICATADKTGVYNTGCAKWFSTIRGFQSIISLFWLFLIGLGLRNNLRMHS